MCQPVRSRREKPPWWPETEPWPPRHELHDRPGRRRFFRRLAAFAFIVMAFGIYGAVTLGWQIITRLRPETSVAPLAFAAIFILAMFALGLVGLSFARLRGATTSLRGVMDAADRVAAGDYRTRVAEGGPYSPIRNLARSFNTMTERLEQHDRQRRDLMADVAHELRTPLTVIQGKLEGLVDGVYPRDDAHLQSLVEETHVLSRLIEDLRTLAQSEAGALKLQKEAVEPGDLVRDAVHAFAGEAEAKHVTLNVDVARDLAPIEVDAVRIREVMTNLLSNALRHTPAGGSVTVRVAAAASGGLSVSVIDTGPGMTADEIARAFDRFYKGTGSRGSGLGLTIAKGLVTAHGGEIRATSEPGRGTTITFTLPQPR